MRNPAGQMNWFPAYYSSSRDNTINKIGTSKITDTAGARNAFLGAFAIGIVRTGDLTEAAIYGNTASSFALEQVGLPALDLKQGKETWNGQDFFERLETYRAMKS